MNDPTFKELTALTPLGLRDLRHLLRDIKIENDTVSELKESNDDIYALNDAMKKIDPEYHSSFVQEPEELSKYDSDDDEGAIIEGVCS